MIRNYLKIALRGLAAHKLFSAINILGLALGIASSLFILLWVQDELSVNRFYTNGSQLFTVMQRQSNEGTIQASKNTPGLLPDELKKQFPEIAYTAGISGWTPDMRLQAGEKLTRQSGEWVGADWFKMFGIPLLTGTAETALNTPNSLAISRKVAELYFGSPDAAMGKTIRINNKKEYQVTAVFADLPANSTDKYQFLMSWLDFVERNPWLKDWQSNSPQTRIMVRPDANMAILETKLKPFLGKYNKAAEKAGVELFLQAFEDTYLYSDFENGKASGGRIEYVRLFTIFAVFLLLIACINFMNLSTARSIKRGREIGVRKVIGAGRGSLIWQFMGETLLLTTIALVIALGIVELLLPAFNTITGKQISIHFDEWSFWGLLLGVTILTSLVAGSYPALFLSSFSPVKVLKGALRFGQGAQLFRRGLVVFQFMLSMLLMVSMVVVYQQMKYIRDKNLGFDRENLIYLAGEADLVKKFIPFKEQAQNSPGISDVSYMVELPSRISSSTGMVQWTGKDPNTKPEFNVTGVGHDFIKTLRIKVRGRDFSPAYGTDSANYLINETAARSIGYADPVGQPLTLSGKPGKIIGVMEDFHFQSLHEPIRPLIVNFNGDRQGLTILVRTQPGQTQEALANLETLWKQFNPASPFTYRFADEVYMNTYKSEIMVSNLTNYLAIIAVFVACIGLFGMSAFMAEQRTKEIGVRKVLGASVAGIMGMLSKDFLRLVLIAIILASPLAWYVMHQWLQQFAYKIILKWWMFAGAGLLAISVALLTVSFQSIKAALVNPVKSLRSE